MGSGDCSNFDETDAPVDPGFDFSLCGSVLVSISGQLSDSLRHEGGSSSRVAATLKYCLASREFEFNVLGEVPS